MISAETSIKLSWVFYCLVLSEFVLSWMVWNVFCVSIKVGMKTMQKKGERVVLKREITELRKELKSRETTAITQILKSADVVLSTNTGQWGEFTHWCEDETHLESTSLHLQVLVMMGLWSSCQRSISIGWWWMSVLRPWRAAAGSLCSERASVFWLETTSSCHLPSNRKSKTFFSTLLSTPVNKYPNLGRRAEHSWRSQSEADQKLGFLSLSCTGLHLKASPSVWWRDWSRCTATRWSECWRFSTAWTAPSWSGRLIRCTRES